MVKFISEGAAIVVGSIVFWFFFVLFAKILPDDIRSWTFWLSVLATALVAGGVYWVVDRLLMNHIKKYEDK